MVMEIIDKMEKIRAMLILEMMGRPPEHIIETITKLVDEMPKSGAKVINRKIAEAKKIEGDLYSTFADVEIEIDGLQNFLSLLFNFMPSHIEIVTPEWLKMNISDLNLFCNELVKKLHQYDEIAKQLMIERQILQKKIETGEIKIVEKGAETKEKKETKEEEKPEEKK